MRKLLICCFATLFSVSLIAAPLQLTPKNIDKIIKELTLEEKAHLVIGARYLEKNKDMAGEVGYTGRIIPGAAGTTYPVPRLGIPAIVLADGPAGLRIAPTRKGDSQTYYCTGFPVGTTRDGKIVPIFKNGECVYESPDLSEIRAYCKDQVMKLWEEVQRFENPHRYYVDLSQKLWDEKHKLLRQGRK